MPWESILCALYWLLLSVCSIKNSNEKQHLRHPASGIRHPASGIRHPVIIANNQSAENKKFTFTLHLFRVVSNAGTCLRVWKNQWKRGVFRFFYVFNKAVPCRMGWCFACFFMAAAWAGKAHALSFYCASSIGIGPPPAGPTVDFSGSGQLTDWILAGTQSSSGTCAGATGQGEDIREMYSESGYLARYVSSAVSNSSTYYNGYRVYRLSDAPGLGLIARYRVYNPMGNVQVGYTNVDVGPSYTLINARVFPSVSGEPFNNTRGVTQQGYSYSPPIAYSQKTSSHNWRPRLEIAVVKSGVGSPGNGQKNIEIFDGQTQVRVDGKKNGNQTIYATRMFYETKVFRFYVINGNYSPPPPSATCTTPNSLNVALPDVYTDDFPAQFSDGPPGLFYLEFTNCSNLSKIRYKIDPVGTAPYQAVLPASPNTGLGVRVQRIPNGGGIPSDVQFGVWNQISTSASSYTIYMLGKYLRIGPLSPGDVNAAMSFTIEYQ